MRTRKETKYRQSYSVSGTYSPKINKFTADRLTAYCKMADVNKNTVVCDAINEYLDKHICECVDNLSRETLLNIFMKKLDRELSTEQIRKIMKEYVLEKPTGSVKKEE